VMVGSPSLRSPDHHTRQNPSKPAADIYLATTRVDYHAHDKTDDPEPSEDEHSGWSFFGRCACPIPGMTNLFALTPESTPNMLLHRNCFSERHLPLPP
jgi:hypothetical protein